jgi:hypothetical protein
MKNLLAKLFLIVFSTLVLTLSLRGLAGNPTVAQLNTPVWKEKGPLELSPDRGRYTLLLAMAEDHSFSFTPALAAFAAPDVAYTSGRYVSLFAPGVSAIILPGYLLGKNYGLSQVGSFAVISIFAIFNILLIRSIAIRLGANPTAASLGGLAFLFGTPAFAYAVSLYQHHISTFLILLSIYLLIRFKNFWSLAAIWFLCAVSITVDYPNFFMMLPVAFAALGKMFNIHKGIDGIKISLPLVKILSLSAVILPLAFFLTFNQLSYGNPLTLSGSIERSVQVNKDGSPVLESKVVEAQEKANHMKNIQAPNKSLLNFFNPRLLLNGFYIHFLSPDRGMLWYTPLMLIGFIGFLASYRKLKYIGLFAAIIGFDVLLYSMWDDPYGGWAFGSRYLIPAYSILSIFIAMALTKLNKYNVFLLAFFIMFSYSVGINTVGAITSSANPPKVEAESLSNTSGTKQDYTFFRNFDQLNKNLSKSFVYQTYAKNSMSAWSYYMAIVVGIITVSAGLLTYMKIALVSKVVDKSKTVNFAERNAVKPKRSLGGLLPAQPRYLPAKQYIDKSISSKRRIV